MADRKDILIAIRHTKLTPKSEDSAETLSGVIKQNAYMGPVIEYTIDSKAGPLFTLAPAYAGMYEPRDEVSVRGCPDEIVIPGNGDS